MKRIGTFVHNVHGDLRNTCFQLLCTLCTMPQYSGHHEKLGDSESRQMSLVQDYFNFHRPEPELEQLKDLDAVIAFTADNIGQVIEAEGCPYSEIAVIYTLKKPDPVREPLPVTLENTFVSRGILSRWESEDYRSK